MSGLSPVAADAPATGERRRWQRRILGVLTVVTGLGALSGVIWKLIVPLPGYTLDSQFRAATTERGLSMFFAADAYYAVLAAVFGLIIGIVVWRVLRPMGWPIVLLAAGGATVAGLVCWLVGQLLGPGPLQPRVAAARPGDFIPLELTLSTPVVLAVWPFAATIPLLLWSSLSPERIDSTALPEPTDTEGAILTREPEAPGTAFAPDDRSL